MSENKHFTASNQIPDQTLRRPHLLSPRGVPSQSHLVPGFNQEHKISPSRREQGDPGQLRDLLKNNDDLTWLVKHLHKGSSKKTRALTPRQRSHVALEVLKSIALTHLTEPQIVDSWYRICDSIKRNHGQPDAKQFTHVVNQLVTPKDKDPLPEEKAAAQVLIKAVKIYKEKQSQQAHPHHSSNP